MLESLLARADTPTSHLGLHERVLSLLIHHHHLLLSRLGTHRLLELRHLALAPGMHLLTFQPHLLVIFDLHRLVCLLQKKSSPAEVLTLLAEFRKVSCSK